MLQGAPPEAVFLEATIIPVRKAWLLDYIEKKESRHSPYAVSAMARAVLDEWRLAHSMNDFKAWLNSGAPSEDASAALAAPRHG